MGECQSIVSNLVSMLFDNTWEPNLDSKSSYKNLDYYYWKQRVECLFFC